MRLINSIFLILILMLVSIVILILATNPVQAAPTTLAATPVEHTSGVSPDPPDQRNP